MRKFTFLLALLTSTAMSWGAQVTSTAGQLATVVTDHSVNTLTINGTLDARDFRFIADSLQQLTTLDMSKASIAAYESTNGAVLANYSSFEAATIPATAFFGSNISSITLPENLKAIGYAAFAGSSALQSITIPASVDSIAAFAFNGTGLKSITVPATVTSVGEAAFSRCPALASATIFTSEVAPSEFSNCEALATVNLSAATTTIGSYAFSGCTALTSFPAEATAIKTINEGAFLGSGLASLDLTTSSALKSVGMWAFANTPTKNVVLPEGIESVGSGAFFYNTELQNIVLPQSVTTVSDFLLAGANKVLADSILGSQTASIGDYAFYNWDQMASFLIPASVATIGTKAMAGMTNLRTLYSNNHDVPALGDSVWAGVDQSRAMLYVYVKSMADYENAEQWKEFKIDYDPTLGVKDVAANSEANVKAHFSGSQLIITASDVISEVRLIDVNGVVLNVVNPKQESAQLETINYSGRYYIVTVTLQNGARRTFKLLRQ